MRIILLLLARLRGHDGPRALPAHEPTRHGEARDAEVGGDAGGDEPEVVVVVAEEGGEVAAGEGVELFVVFVFVEEAFVDDDAIGGGDLSYNMSEKTEHRGRTLTRSRYALTSFVSLSASRVPYLSTSSAIYLSKSCTSDTPLSNNV